MAPIIFDPVLGGINEFLDWALFIVSILLIYYIIKFFFVAPPTAEDKAKSRAADDERRKNFVEWVRKKHGEGEAKKVEEQHKKEEAARKEKDDKEAAGKKKSKHNSINPIRALLATIINEAEEGSVKMLHASSVGHVDEVRGHVKNINEAIRAAWRELRKLRDHASGEEHKELNELAAHAHHMVSLINERALSSSDPTKWLEKEKRKKVLEKLTHLKNGSGVILQKLQEILAR